MFTIYEKAPPSTPVEWYVIGWRETEAEAIAAVARWAQRHPECEFCYRGAEV